MISLRQKLMDKIIEVGERHYSWAIKKDVNLYSELINATINYGELSTPERVVIILHDQKPICSRGNRRKFKNLNTGFVNCGMAGKCQCTREAVSNSCKTTISQRSKDVQQQINDKRVLTVQEIYGSDNVSRVTTIQKKREVTMLERYGVRSILSIQELKEQGMLHRYGVRNPAQLTAMLSQARETYKIRTGYDHPMRNPIVIEQLISRRSERFAFNVSEAKLDSGYDNLLTLIPDHIEPLFSRDTYRGYYQNRWLFYNFRCRDCHTEFTRVLVRPTALACPKCDVKYQSEEENEIADLITSWGFQVRRGDMSMINPFQLDIVIDSKKIAVEYGGLYWHSQISGKKHPEYHRNKLNMCEKIGYRLITIFSDEWIYRRSIVENRLCSIFGVTERGSGARSLNIHEVEWQDAEVFLEEHHMQGAGLPGFVRLGAFEGEVLHCLMTFGHSRFKKSDPYTELLRFCTDGYNYPGAASKLFKSFIRRYNPLGVVSYADRRWSTGHLYHTLGFELSSYSRPSYAYFCGRNPEREHRLSYTKKKIIQDMNGDPSLTEWENMQVFGYDRIWDCGTATFVWRSH
jgi:hypothetical protein